MAGGLSSNQLRELVEEHGSIEAALEARPELTDELRAVQRIGRALLRVPQPKRFMNKIDNQAAAFEKALDRHARRQMKRIDSRRRKPREYKTQEFPHAMFIKAIRLLGEGVPVTSVRPPGGIAEQTGLDRHLVVKIREFVAGRGYQARPGQRPGTVVLVRVSETAS